MYPSLSQSQGPPLGDTSFVTKTNHSWHVKTKLSENTQIYNKTVLQFGE